MSEYRIKMGKPETSQPVTDFKKTQADLEDPTLDTRRKVFIIIIVLTLLMGVYVIFFRKPVEMPGPMDVSAQPSKENLDDDLQQHELFTPEMVRSFSTPIEDETSRKQKEVYDSNQIGSANYGSRQGGMVVLKETPSFYPNQRPSIFIPPGTILEAHLDGKVVASSMQTPVMAIVDEDYEYQEKVLVPKGSKLIGNTLGVQGGNRVLIQFRELVYPDNSSIYSFAGVVIDEDKSVGIIGEADRGSVYHTGTSFASTVLGIGADSIVGQNQSIFGEVAGRTIQNSTQDLSSLMSQSPSNSASAVTVTLTPDVPIKVLATNNELY